MKREKYKAFLRARGCVLKRTANTRVYALKNNAVIFDATTIFYSIRDWQGFAIFQHCLCVPTLHLRTDGFLYALQRARALQCCLPTPFQGLAD